MTPKYVRRYTVLLTEAEILNLLYASDTLLLGKFKDSAMSPSGWAAAHRAVRKMQKALWTIPTREKVPDAKA